MSLAFGLWPTAPGAGAAPPCALRKDASTPMPPEVPAHERAGQGGQSTDAAVTEQSCPRGRDVMAEEGPAEQWCLDVGAS